MSVRENNDALHEAAVEYVELTEMLSKVQGDLAVIRRQLLDELVKGDGIEVSSNTVLAVTDHPADRRPITQKMLHDAGVPKTAFDKLMAVTKPPTEKRIRGLRVVLKSDFEARVRGSSL
jgi:hypothetical protein